MDTQKLPAGLPYESTFGYAERLLAGPPRDYNDAIEAHHRYVIEAMLKEWREDRARLKAVTAEAREVMTQAQTLIADFRALKLEHARLVEQSAKLEAEVAEFTGRRPSP